MPCYDALFPHAAKSDETSAHLSERVRSFARNTFAKLLALFERADIVDQRIALDIKPCMDQLLADEAERKRKEYTFVSNCHFCTEIDYLSMHAVSLVDKMANKYAKSAMFFGVQAKADGLKQAAPFVFDAQFCHKYAALKYLGLMNQPYVERDEATKTKTGVNDLELLRLDMKNNAMSTLPHRLIGRSPHLRSVHISRNPIKTITDPRHVFARLDKLQILELIDIGVVDGSLADIRLPDSLTSLSLGGCALDRFPFELNQLSERLERLTLTGVRWLDLERYGDMRGSQELVVVPVEATQEELEPWLSGEQVQAVYASELRQVRDLRKQFMTWREAVEFNALLFARFARLRTVPSEVFTLTALVRLDLSYQAIRDIPDQIAALRSLVTLTCNNCIRLETLSAKLAHIASIKDVYVRNCVSMKTPPLEICRRGSPAILGFLKRLSSG